SYSAIASLSSLTSLHSFLFQGGKVHYREAIVWKKAMRLAREVYRLAPRLPKEETYGMRSQLTRAAVSIPANIAEGWTRESDREKAWFLAIAHGSLAEAEPC
ncbi:MAG: four helix bundle protein, partial [Longimicrobiales bacterium]